MKWPLPSRHWVVHNNPTPRHFATELPPVCAVNDAFWQQLFDFRRPEPCPVPSPSVRVAGTAAAVPGFAHQGGEEAQVKSQDSGIAANVAALGIWMRPVFVLSGDCNALGW